MPGIQNSASASPQVGAQAPRPANSAPQPSPTSRPKTAPLHQIYGRPLPIRTFPLPSFYPSNPLSLLQIAWTWTSQILSPPPAEPSVVWDAIWSLESRSVHVVDPKAIRALWEQGFYGKGNLSRSEPNWLKREKVRRGLAKAHVSEEMTAARRAERIKMKWDRARAEQEAIRQTRLEEARQASALSSPPTSESSPPAPAPAPLAKDWDAPTGPVELLGLPNSLADLMAAATVDPTQVSQVVNGTSIPIALSGQMDDRTSEAHETTSSLNGTSDLNSSEKSVNGIVKSHSSPTDTTNATDDEPKTLKRSKSVRFSPKVESATYQLSDPPSPSYALVNEKPIEGSVSLEKEHNSLDKSVPGLVPAATNANSIGGSQSSEIIPETPPDEEEVLDKEHLQLTAEEAFFLSFGLGALNVTNSETRAPMDAAALFKLFRQYSTFPARSEQDLAPDDGFLVNYAVYHHFRSLGWVPRPGIKFGTDWMLYAKGPVFDHAEFGVMVLPSYSDPWWEASGRPASGRSWTWLHCVIRVLAHVQKSLLLVYVDVPPPPAFNEASAKGIAEVLKLYKVREVMVKRWSANRNR